MFSRAGIKLDQQQLRYLELFELITKVEPLDCLMFEDKLVFLVPPHQAARAVGRNGVNVKQLWSRTSKHIEILEYSDDPREFVAGLLRNLKLSGIEIWIQENSGTKSLHIQLDHSLRGLVVGKGGKKLRLIRELLRRYYNIQGPILE